jgi:tetratricopeptide (TPR) repeat protein
MSPNHLSLARSAYSHTDYRSALENFQQYLGVNSNDDTAWVELGNTQRQLHQYHDAVQSYQHAININPDQTDAHYYLRVVSDHLLEIGDQKSLLKDAATEDECRYLDGNLYSLYGDTDKALAAYHAAIQANPRHAASYYKLGRLYLFENKLEESQTFFEQALAIEPESHQTYLQLAHLASMRGDTAQAAQYDRQALELTSKSVITPPTVQEDIPTQFGMADEGKGLPIVFIHRNLGVDARQRTAIEYCLAQARRTNPLSPIYLIGDMYNRYPFIKNELMLDYFERAFAFGKIYRHIAQSIRYDYLLFCFQRWFVLLEFMRAKKIERCLHIDSDVMLYTDVTEQIQSFPSFDLFLSAHPDFAVSGHYNYIGSQGALEALCNYIFDVFTREPMDDAILTPFQDAVWRSRTGYITDMSGLEECRDYGILNIRDLSAIRDGSVYDANVNSADGFVMRAGLKAIDWVDGIPFGTLRETGKKIRFHALHFNNNAKRYIRQAFHQALP